MNDLRIALMNYIVSRQRSEQFIVRIEDMDKEHNIEGKDQEILDLLKKFAIEQDQLFYQSDNLGRHQQFALSLVSQGKAFACICTSGNEDRCSGKCLQTQETVTAQIKAEDLPYVIRIKEPEEVVTFTDKLKGVIHTKPHELGDFAILDTNGDPSYDLATACDDMLTNISLVICSEEQHSNTPRQIHIKRSLGYSTDAAYAHLPMILDPSSKEMNIQDDVGSIKWLLSEGFLLDTIINYLLLVGNETPTEIFTLPEAIAWFDLEKISKEAVTLDIDTLRSLNREHLASMEDIALSRIFGFADADIGKLLKLYLEEASTINELDLKIKAIFAPKTCTEEWREEMQTIAALIQEAPMFKDLNDLKQYITEKSGLEEEALLSPLRLLMTGAEECPELDAIYPLIKPYITEIARCISC